MPIGEWPADRNMYGCTPCPKCKSKYRHPGTQGEAQRGVHETVCDDCGYREPWDEWLTEYLKEDE